MPKVNSIQTSFHGGEFSPMLYGQVHADRFKTGLQVCLNYLPTLQGPLIRRPGTKYLMNVKDPVNPPALIPFVFSQSQSYVLEFGSSYIRFYADNGQIIANSNIFKVSGLTGMNGAFFTQLQYTATTDNPFGTADQAISASSVIAAGATIEVASPYLGTDVSGIRFAQQNDTLYLTHPSYAPYKLQRFSNYSWTLRPLILQDGPYLPINSYKTIGDNTKFNMTPTDVSLPTISTGPNNIIYGAANNGAGLVRIRTNSPHPYSTGDKVFITGVGGTTEANNIISGSANSISQSFWRVSVFDTTHVDLLGSAFVNNPVGSSGVIYPAIFEMNQAPISGSSPVWSDATQNKLRNIALIGSDGFRHWGVITGVINPGQVTAVMNNALPNTNTCNFWQLGTYSLGNGFPRACSFHQDRLVFAGATNFPQQLDGSQAGNYEAFAASGSSLQVADNNAYQFRLLSDEANPVMWLKSAPQGLLAGSQSAEWQVSPNNQSQALTPTNVSATATSYFGSANVDAVKAGNAIIYVQRAFRKIREMNFFFQVGTFRSTDLTEIAEHITIPTVTKLSVQKETIPLIWGVRTDGNLLSMSYSRDDVTLKAGWSRHQLGGQSDSAGTNPVVKSIASIPSTVGSSTYDQMWMVVQRSTMSGSTFTSVEYSTRPYEDSILQEDAFQGDCGATYDSPLPITNIFQSSVFVGVTSPAHGLSNGDKVRITQVVGLNSSVVDAYGNAVITNFANENTFVVASASFLSFALAGYQGEPYSLSGYSPYVSGGQVRKMVQTISGLNWLNGETVGILADGAIHRDVVVASGSITLDYRAAKVQIGYRFNSDGQSLRQDGGSAQGTAIGETSRMHRVAAMFHNMGDFAMGQTFTDLVPVKFQQADQQVADQRTPLFSGIERDATGAQYDFDGWVCWRQSSMLPGMLNALVYFQEVQDV